MDRRVYYASSVHDEREIEAVVEVLRDPRGFWVGKRVNQMERQVSELFGKQYGVMVNSGSSALYLAVELLGLRAGSEVILPAVTFSTDIAPVVRAGLIPSFVDVEPDTYNIDADRIADAITPRTRAILAANLIGNVPDWDEIRRIADRPRPLASIEDSCDALGAELAGEAHRERAPTITVTSFASSHIITCAGTGGMLMLGRRRPARPGDPAAPLGPAVRAPVLRVEAARPDVLGGSGRHPLRQPVHLRRAGLELRALRGWGRLRAGAARQTGRQPVSPATELRHVHRVLSAARGPVSRAPATPTMWTPPGSAIH